MSYYPVKSALFTTIDELEGTLGTPINKDVGYVIVTIPVPAEHRAAYLADPDVQRKACVFLHADNGDILLELTDGLIFVPDVTQATAYRWDHERKTFSDAVAGEIDQIDEYVGQRFYLDLNEQADASEIPKIKEMIANGLAERRSAILLADVPDTLMC